MRKLDLSPIETIMDRMDKRLDELSSLDDHRAIFLAVYRAMTGQMHEALPQARFLDAPWTLSLTTRFAGMYFEADEAFVGGKDCPPPWERAFRVAATARAFTLEHAMLGINAHITYDLPRAVAATMRDFGDLEHDAGSSTTKGKAKGMPVEGVIARRRYDYEVVNDILANTTDMVEDLIGKRFSPLMKVVDVLALRFDEYVAEMILRFTRTQGWNTALALAFAKDAKEEELIRQQLVKVSLEMIERIDVVNYLPHPMLKRAMGLLRQPFLAH